MPDIPALPSTRERILAYLQEHPTVTSAVLSRAWGLTRADIRYHLNALVAEGLIEPVSRPLSPAQKRGRPEQSFRLSAGHAPDNFPALCTALLDLLVSAPDQEGRIRQLTTLAEHLVGSLPLPSQPIQRFNQAVAYLNQHSFRARWEAYTSGPRLLLHHCPYAAVLPLHPELCILDRLVIERLTGSPMVQTAQIDRQTGRPAACIFAGRSG